MTSVYSNPLSACCRSFCEWHELCFNPHLDTPAAGKVLLYFRHRTQCLFVYWALANELWFWWLMIISYVKLLVISVGFRSKLELELETLTSDGTHDSYDSDHFLWTAVIKIDRALCKDSKTPQTILIQRILIDYGQFTLRKIGGCDCCCLPVLVVLPMDKACSQCFLCHMEHHTYELLS